MHRYRGIALNRDWAAQAIDRQALDEIIGGGGFAVEQQIVAVAPDEKSNRHLPCGVRSPAQTGSAPATSLVTSPCRKPRTSSPERRTTARSVEGGVAAMIIS